MKSPTRLPAQGIAKAIKKAGGKTALARLLNLRGHNIGSHATIHMWKLNQVPAHYCPCIEALTGVMCEELRPDVAWSVLRNSVIKPATSRTAQPRAKTAETLPVNIS